MARMESLNMLLEQGGKDMLKELYGRVVENIQKATLSTLLKNTELSGDPNSGTVEARRLVNAVSQDYGTARGSGRGGYIKVAPVTVAIDKNKEIVEEIEDKDVAFSSVDDVLKRRAANHVLTMTRELELAFFEEAVAAGTELSLTETEAAGMLEEAVRKLESVKNEYIYGVPRDLISVVASSEFYGKLRGQLDSAVSNANVDTAAERFSAYHGVRVDPSIYLPEGTDFVVMARGAVAQPVRPRPYAAEKIPLSEAYALELFFYYGTKAVMPDLIFYK